MTTDDVDAVVAMGGSGIVDVTDPTAIAEAVADRLGTDVTAADGLDAALDERAARAAERVAAHAALEIHDRIEQRDELEPHVVTDIPTMRTLVRRLAEADQMVEESHVDARRRARAVTTMAVHPDSIRAAATDVVDAREALDARIAERERDDVADRDTAGDTDHDESDTSGDTAALPPVSERWWGAEVRERLLRAIAAFGASVAIAIVVLGVVGTPFGFVLPAVAVCWIVVVLVRQRDDAIDAEIASQNLANVGALTDTAYGGAASVTGDELAGGTDAERRVAEARERLRYAESAWHSLVGADADVDDLERVIQLHDPQHGADIDASVLSELPSVRATAAHRRRILAQWKLAWWALDRDVPMPESAVVEALAAEGADVETVTTH